MIERRAFSSAVLLGSWASSGLGARPADAARYRVPADLPDGRYSIDAVSTRRRAGRGPRTITLHNRSAIALEVLALDWTETKAACSTSPPAGGAPAPRRAAARTRRGVNRLAGAARRDSAGDGSRSTSASAGRGTCPGRRLPSSRRTGTHASGGTACRTTIVLRQARRPGRLRPGRERRLDPRTAASSEGSAPSGSTRQGLKAESRDATACSSRLFTEKGAQAAAVCLETALDAVRFYRDWLGFYPIPS